MTEIKFSLDILFMSPVSDKLKKLHTHTHMLSVVMAVKGYGVTTQFVSFGLLVPEYIMCHRISYHVM